MEVEDQRVMEVMDKMVKEGNYKGTPKDENH
jgi:hypothetical protein